MSPEKDENLYYQETEAFASRKSLASPGLGEEIVISGISGVFPDSRNVSHFRDNLYNKIDMVSSDNRRWKPVHYGIPHRTGKICDIQKFDAGFFGVHHRQATSLDPTTRLFLERTIEAIFDAGIHPSELEGTRTGVFVGACFSESEKTWFFDSLHAKYFTITGNERSMIANRVSFHLKLAGPSNITDSACSSSLYAVEQAYKALRTGTIDMAIVGGTNLVLHPFVSLHFARLGVLSEDGACKAFDQKADGYARSETVACIFLQRAKDSRRIYGEVIHVKSNCDGYKPQSITYPSGEAQKELMQEFYQECEILPTDLSFLEAHGTGTVVGDPEELLGIDEVFCKNRTTPLLMGSVKSNIGHTEPSSGLCSIIKCIIGMENGLIPPNFHYKNPREGIKALEEGRLKVVTEKTPFEDERGLMGVNSFGFGGANAHVLLRWHKKIKGNGGLPKDDLPRLVCVNSRVEDGIDSILNDLSSRPLDAELVRLYHQIFCKDTPGYFFRSYSIISKSGELKRANSRFCDLKKPLCLVFTSFNTSWSKIAHKLFKLPIFAASIQRVHNILSNRGINVCEIVLNGGKAHMGTVFDNIIGSTTVQIALADVLKILNVNPDGYCGFGFGELICGYFHGSLTLEETVLSIFHIASNFHDLNKKKILQVLNQVIEKPKLRGSKWLSAIDSTLASADHFVDAIFSRDSSLNIETHFPKGSVILEVGNQPPNIAKSHYSLLSFESTENSFVNFLETLGNLYQFGYSFFIDRLYSKVKYPVSRGTPMVSPLIKWHHRDDWFVTFYDNQTAMKTGEKSFCLSLLEDEWKYIEGHVIDGRNLFPATGYLFLAWSSFSVMTGFLPSNMKIVMENCKFVRATTVPKHNTVELTVMIQRGSGKFEVLDGGAVVVTGTIRMFNEKTQEQINLPLPVGLNCNEALALKAKDIYKELRLRGYNYSGAFRRIVECDNDITKSLISWDSNWVTFIDNMLQLKILQNDTRNLYVPTAIGRLTIDGEQHLAYTESLGQNPNLPVHIYKDYDIIKCGGIEIRGLRANSIARRKPRGEPVLEKYEFVPNHVKLSIQDSVRVFMQLILENLPGYKVKTIELIDDASNDDFEPISPIIHDVLSDLPLIQPSIIILTKKKLVIPNVTVEDKKLITETDSTLVVGSDLLQNMMLLNQAFGAIKENAFVLSRESLDFEPKAMIFDHIDILAIYTTHKERFYLIRKTAEFEPPTIVDISNSNEQFVWLTSLQEAVRKDSNVIILAQNKPLSGILGLVNCIRREPGCAHVRAVILFGEAPPFDLNNPFYSDQLKKKLAINVYKNSKWGTYRHILLDKATKVEREHCFCDAVVRGDLSSLKWLEGQLSQDIILPPEKDLVYVYYSALNFRDIMSASGRISSDAIIKDRTQQEFIHGFEYTGRTKTGKRVFGIVSGALSTLLLADRYFLWPCPDFWSLEEAATVPVVYSTVLYAFFIACTIKKGKSILIHAGSGGVGQAAISVALHYGLTVYTTVGTKEKREFLKKTFPQLKDHHIGNSRDTSFEQMIEKQTQGRGVDYVLNSLSEEKLLASVRCLAPGGHFMEIGKFDLISNNPVYLKFLERGASFHGIMVDAVFSLEPKEKVVIRKLMSEGVMNGAIRPLVRTIFKMEEIEEAFRYMAAGKHIGKVLIQLRQEESEKIVVPTRKLFRGLPRFSCNSHNVHIIVGGLGGFGLELADWLVLRGSRNLVLTSRSGVVNGYQSFRIKTWLSYGVRVHISTADVTTMTGCQQLIDEATNFGCIESIFNLAVVLKDAIFENQTVDNFRESLKPKAFATELLDEITRKLCPNLRDFVVFSSVSCGRGNAGQTNYGMANSIMERICEKRNQEGLPAVAIQWGVVGDVGLVAELQEKDTEMEIAGTLQQRITSCLHVLDTLLVQKNAVVSSMVVAEKREGVGKDNVVEAVAHILGLGDLKTVSLHVSLSELGMDSMTGVEIKQTLEREYDVFLTPHDIRSMTFARLKEIQEERASEDDADKKDKALGSLEIVVRLMADEATSKIPLIRLKSRIQETSSASNIICFAGIEGVAKVLAPLAINLNRHVHCFQFISETQRNTITEMAESLLPAVEKLISKNEPFNILAYSYGALVAFEVVSMLEAKGYLGTIFSIDGAPDMLIKLLKNNLNVSSEAVFQTAFLMRVMSLYMSSEIILKHKQRLLLCQTFEDRLNIAEEIAPKDNVHSISYLKDFSRASYTRLKALSNYQVTYPKIKSNVKLFKPENISVSGLTEDYQLTEMCENPVDVRIFKGNHVSILDNVEMAEAINNVVSPSTRFDKEKILIDDAVKMEISKVEIKQI